MPPNPAAGFDDDAPVAVVPAPVPELLVQPPNSSSTATFGAGANPPDGPGMMLCDAKDADIGSRPQPKSAAAPVALVTPGLFE